MKREYSVDIVLVLLILVLLSFGIIMVFSASAASAFYYHNGDSYFFVRKQALLAFVGLVLMFWVGRINYRLFSVLSFQILVVSILLLVIVTIPGIGVSMEKNGARRWLGVGSISFQPSEVAKVALIVFFAAHLSQKKTDITNFVKGLMPYIGVLGVFIGLLLLQKHTSAMALITLVGTVVLIAAGAKISHFVLLAFPGLAGLATLIMFSPYRLKRVTTFLDPFASGDSDATYQLRQSLMAIGSGGLFGLGLGRSRQKYLYLPEAQNDFIFSIICEELGLVGATFVIILFILLIWRGLRIAIHAPDTFSCLLVVGIMALISIQVLVNIAVATGSMPVTGMPLPFVSAGGTSLLFTLLEMGIVLNVSRYST